MALEAEVLATGHYARVSHGDGSFRLLRAVDAAKDQSYVLCVLGQGQLAHALFPVGDLTKAQVRREAERFSLPTAARPESQDLCFLGDLDYRTFLRMHDPASASPGPILDPGGNVIGSHRGLANFTIGQRKGLGLSSSAPLYVLEKRPETNSLVVGPKGSLGTKRFEAADVNWVNGAEPASPLRASVRVRYKGREVPAQVTPVGTGRVSVELDNTLPDVTPGQAAVFYDGEVCLGGGVILR
jgi:tRNA-specific 2-thiouridylase